MGSEHNPGLSTGIYGNSHSDTPPQVDVASSEEQSSLEEEVRSMINKGAVVELPKLEQGKGFFSSMFLVPKKGEGSRPVINLKHLNKFIPAQHFKMEGFHTLRDVLRREDWMTKVDLKDAYFMIPIWEEDRKLLRFSVQNRLFKFTCLPFSLSCPPWVFTKTPRPAISTLRELVSCVYFSNMSNPSVSLASFTNTCLA